jgi:thiol-disulfide isomerase/thioredoxin
LDLEQRRGVVENNRPAPSTLHAAHRRPRSLASLTTLWIACFGAAVACGGGGKPAADAGHDDASLVGSPAPDAEFAPLRGGETLKLSALRGKVVLLDFWASWCVPCQEELPLLDEMATRLAGKGIEFVGVSIDEEKSDAEGFLERKKSWTLKLGHDPEQAGAKLFNPPKMPTSYVIDREGVVRHVNAGFQRADVEKVEAQLNAAASAE